MQAGATMSSKKRLASEMESLLSGVKVFLIDIEGTMTPLSFTKDILFPYVTDNLQNYLETHFDEDSCLCDIESLRQLAKQDEKSKVIGATRISNTDADRDLIIQDVVANVKWQMSQDRKTTALKQLQGHIWKEAYNLGEIKGELFSDVVPVLHQLKEMGMKHYIYSSGSIDSQKLLFSHTREGNIIDLFSGFFDTVTGSKVDCESYNKIVEEINVKADEIMFLTDNPKEAAAATSAGVKCYIVIRAGNEALSQDDHSRFCTIHSFTELINKEEAKPSIPKKKNLEIEK